ncbi:MAG: amidase [Solirubrobacteraceae bacterium]
MQNSANHTSDHDRAELASRATVAEQIRMLAAGEVTSSELVAGSLERIAATQPTLNAFRLVFEDSAMAEAQQADQRLQAGEHKPLLGVPIAVKDDVDVAGEPTAFGCAGPFASKSADCEMVRRLRAAGAVIVGKTNTPEIGLYPFTEGQAFGVTRNPWNLNHTPGGSSGGGAAAVAAGVVAGAIGSDGAGSVRIPAAWSGLVGIKPQRGRIPTWPAPEAFMGLTCFGPLTHSVADAALLLDVLSGSHPGDLHSPPAPSEPFLAAAGRDPGRLRIALSLRAPFSGTQVRLHPEIRAATVRLSRVLSELGHEVIDRDPNYGLMGLTLVIRGQAGVYEWARSVPDLSFLDPRTRSAAHLGRLFTGRILRLARRAEPWLQRRVGVIFKDVDVVLTPTSASPPLPIGVTTGRGGWSTDQIMAKACPYAWPWNVLGWPGMSVPAGFTNEGLPIGAQLLGPANSESLLIALAAQLEGVERWQDHRAPRLV